jgi:phosphoadenylyl-sulfate reductase (thioredoxin)
MNSCIELCELLCIFICSHCHTLFVGYLPPETYHYAAQLKALFDLNVKIYQSEISPAHMEAIHGKLWEKEEPNAHRLYGLLRKVMPMRKAQKELNASLMLTGVRRSQTSHRKTMPIYTPAANENECGKVSPILSFTDEDTVQYFTKYDLPQHPLVAFGYTSVGDAHSSRPRLESDKDDRATRFGNSKQQECGLHTETGSLEEYDKMIAKAMRKSATDDEPDHVLPAHTLPSGYLVFGRVACKYCRAAKALLTSKGLPFTEYLVIKPGEETPDSDKSSIKLGQLVQLVREVTEDSDRKVSAVPQIFLDRNYVGGFSELYPTLEVTHDDADALLQSVTTPAAPSTDSADTQVEVQATTTVPPIPEVPLVGCEAGLPKEMAAFFRGKI